MLSTMIPIMKTSRRIPLSSRHRRIINKPKVNLGLLGSLLCLLGFFLITASLYSAIQKQQQQIKQPNNYNTNNVEVDGDWGFPNITIFAAPRPFSYNGSDSVGARQELAVRSWLGLSSDVKVVLFGQHPSVHEFASSLGNRVIVESDIDFTFLGNPFFHSMIARTQAYHSGISVLVDPETVLLPDIITTLHYVHKLNLDWFLVSISSSILHFPFILDDTGKHWLQKDGKRIGTKKLQDFLVHNRQWNNCGERILMAWNTVDPPLHGGVLPPFVYGKGLHNEWLVNEVLSSDLRFVIDATLAASSFYLESLGPQFNKLLPNSGRELNKTWEYGGNHHLASLYGSLYLRANNILSIRLVKCSGKYLLLDLAHSTFYSVNGLPVHALHSLTQVPGQEQKSWLSTRFLQSRRMKKWINCMEAVRSLDKKSTCTDWYKVSFKKSMPLSLSLSLKSLLQIIADEDKSVVLAVVGDNYRDMLMNWVCRLRRLAVKNFIVCALDSEIYQFSVLQGLPVFKDPLAPSNISFNDCHFGTQCFQRVTKVKSRIVLKILKLGYNVLMSDVDIYWFENPLPFLRSFGPAILQAQSDEFNETVPINLPRRLNSGFYFARSDPPTIAALEKVVKHASTSDLSEQPSFYDVLCGEGGVNRVGDDRCLEPETNLTVVFLNLSSFPNGAYKGLWQQSNVRSACQKLGCVILHNNWISGRQRKLERQIRSGLWDYDSSSRMCIQSWQRNAFTSPNTYRQELKFQRESDNLGYGEQEHKMAVSMTCSYHQRIQIQKSLDRGSVQVKLTHTLEMVYSSNCRCLPLQPARRKKDGADCSIYDSMAYSELSSVSAVQNKDSVVRIVLASRMVEVYDGAILAYSVMHKYPGLCLARPEVFKRPHESLVGPKEVLLPGQKFYLVPKTTVKKLQQNHPKKPQALGEAAVRGMVSDHQVSDKEEGEEAVCSAKNFNVANEERSQRLVRKLVKGSGKQEQKKPFNPPIKTSPRRKKGVLDGWKPALTSVEEISP